MLLEEWPLLTLIMPNEIIKNGVLILKEYVMTCGKCGDLIRAHKPTGCVIRDPKTFMPFYKEISGNKKETAC